MELNLENKEFKDIEVNEAQLMSTSSTDSVPKNTSPEKRQCWSKLYSYPAVKALLILFSLGAVLLVISFASCGIGRHIKLCPLPLYSLDVCRNGVFKKFEKLNQTMRDILDNEEYTEDENAIELCEPTGTGTAGSTGLVNWHKPCEGKITFKDGNNRKKTKKLNANGIKGYKKFRRLDTKNVLLTGTCCVELYDEIYFDDGGNTDVIRPRFNEAPNLQNIRSMKFAYCNDR